jgi:NTP-dependent ternary system trypsin peptidase co-occuring protein
MKQLVEYELDDGGTIVVEVDLSEAGLQRVSRGDEIVKATVKFSEALDQVRSAAKTVIAKLRTLPDPPDEMVVEFGFSLGAKAGAVIASADMQANYKVTMTWKHSDQTSSPTPDQRTRDI